MTDAFDTEDDCLDNIDDDNLWNMLDVFVQKNDDNNISDNKQSETNISTNTPVCSVCNSTSILFNDSSFLMTCIDCGAGLSELFELRPEWNNYEDSNDAPRCGVATNPFMPMASMGTVITGGGYSNAKRMQIWDQIPYKERSLSEVLQHIDVKMKKFKITKSVIDNAKILYKKLSSIKHLSGPNIGKTIIIRGLNRRSLIASCAFYGAKFQKTPRSIKEIAEIFCLETTQVTKGCRIYTVLMDFSFMLKHSHLAHAQDFIERFGYRLLLKKPHVEFAIKIASNVNKLDIASDHQSTSIAAGSILLTSHIYELNITRKKVAEIFGISEVTITKTFKKIYPYKKILMNDSLTTLLLKRIDMRIAENPDILLKKKDVPSVSITDIFIVNKEPALPKQASSDNLISSDISDTISIQSLMCSDDINTITTTNTNAIIIKKKRGRPRKNIAPSSI